MTRSQLEHSNDTQTVLGGGGTKWRYSLVGRYICLRRQTLTCYYFFFIAAHKIISTNIFWHPSIQKCGVFFIKMWN